MRQAKVNMVTKTYCILGFYVVKMLLQVEAGLWEEMPVPERISGPGSKTQL
jgi:hypothetical protein